MKGRIDETSIKDIKLDIKDQKILSFLNENSRATFTQISKDVHLSRDAVRYRINNLKEKNIINSFTTIINQEKLGYSSYFILFQTRGISELKEKELFKILKRNKHIMRILSYSDKWDLGVEILAKDLNEFDDILTNLNEELNAYIKKTTTLITTKRYFSKLFPGESKIIKDDTFTKIDPKDKKLLKLLNKDARVPLPSLVNELNLSVDAIIYRIKKLTKLKVIEKFSTSINFSSMGYELYTVFLDLKPFDEKLIKSIFSMEENILSAKKTLGHWNIMLDIVTKDPSEFHKIIKNIKIMLGKNLKDYDTLLSYKEHKYGG